MPIISRIAFLTLLVRTPNEQPSHKVTMMCTVSDAIRHIILNSIDLIPDSFKVGQQKEPWCAIALQTIFSSLNYFYSPPPIVCTSFIFFSLYYMLVPFFEDYLLVDIIPVDNKSL